VGVLIVVSAVMALAGGFFKSVGTLFNLALDLADGRAHCMEGRTSTSWAGEGGESMKASGTTCKVYMTPRSKLLLSLEPVKLRRP
jgi:hypothetical protein